jgi:hypothetical protein
VAIQVRRHAGVGCEAFEGTGNRKPEAEQLLAENAYRGLSRSVRRKESANRTIASMPPGELQLFEHVTSDDEIQLTGSERNVCGVCHNIWRDKPRYIRVVPFRDSSSNFCATRYVCRNSIDTHRYQKTVRYCTVPFGRAY